jgi:rare lipoprotein A
MTDPRRLLLPFVAVTAATVIAAVDQTSASFFPGSLGRWVGHPSALGRPDEAPIDALSREISRLERSEGLSAPEGYEEIGQASWYGQWHHGRTTASGEKFDMNKLTAAHRSLPLGSSVRVTNLDNGRTVDVTINDRGPFIAGRVIDLSREAARELRMEREGLAPVLVEELLVDSAATAESASGAN